MIDRILVAVDDSPAAFRAAGVAIDLAATLGCGLVAVTVMHDHALDERIGAVSSPVGERRVFAAHAVLRHVQVRAEAARVAVETVQVSGEPAAQVLAEARRSGADLVVIARTSHGAQAAAYIGFEAQRILEFSDVPVLVVPPPAR